jgi:ribosomal protein L36
MKTEYRDKVVHKSTPKFALIERRGRLYVVCQLENHKPRVLRISRKDFNYLNTLNSARKMHYHANTEFDNGCVEVGCGVFQP